jgi:hypothetical protein
MRRREKARIFRRFMRGESCIVILRWAAINHKLLSMGMIEGILREGLDGAFDLPMKQARAYAKAAGVKVGRMVKV